MAPDLAAPTVIRAPDVSRETTWKTAAGSGAWRRLSYSRPRLQVTEPARWRRSDENVPRVSNADTGLLGRVFADQGKTKQFLLVGLIHQEEPSPEANQGQKQHHRKRDDPEDTRRQWRENRREHHPN